MKIITENKMTNINGGMKCIYHGMLFWIAGAGTIGGEAGELLALWQCWNNIHPE